MRIIVFGKLSDSEKDIENHYLKQLKNLEILEYKELHDLKKEEDKIKEVLKGSEYFALDETGIEMTSVDFSKLITDKSVFVIGAMHGLSPEIKKNAKKVISLSKMTFTHRFARLVLVEQIYRAISIKENKPYHR